MKTISLRRIVSSVAWSFAAGMVMTDALACGCFLRCRAEADATWSPPLGARPNERRVDAHVPLVPADVSLYAAAN
jgi:hypothetical protein